MNASEMREVTAEEMQTVEGGGFLSEAIRKVGQFLQGAMDDGFQKSQGKTTLSSEPPPNL